MQYFWASEIVMNETFFWNSIERDFFVRLALTLPYISDSAKAVCLQRKCTVQFAHSHSWIQQYCKLLYANILHQKASALLTRPLIYPGLHKIGCCFSNKTKENSVCISDSGEMVKEGVCSSEENLLAAHCHHPWLVGWMYRTSTGWESGDVVKITELSALKETSAFKGLKGCLGLKS